jgi:cold shock CspA family protein
MQSPVRIEFQGMNPTDVVQDQVLRYVAELESRFGRVTAGHVVVKVPGEHHRTGGLYEINIRLALPDHKEVNVGRTPGADERHSDIDFALHDAFKRARRQLQDRTRRLQGHIKVHEAQPTGRVTHLENDFGVLETADGRGVYFHRNSMLNGDFAKLSLGARVSFVEEIGEKGPQASTVRLVGKHSLRL